MGDCGYQYTIGICQNLVGIGIRNTKLNSLSNLKCKLIDCLNMLAFCKATLRPKLFADINRTNAKKSLPPTLQLVIKNVRDLLGLDTEVIQGLLLCRVVEAYH